MNALKDCSLALIEDNHNLDDGICGESEEITHIESIEGEE